MELWAYGLGDLARLVKSGQVSSREVVQAHLQRIDAINPALNALPRVLADDALAAADEADRILAGGGRVGALHHPAQCTGIASIKPGFGRVPRATGNPEWESPISHQLLNAEGPMGRDVEDIRLALEIMSRPSLRDPWHVQVDMPSSKEGRR